jgi:hypothetical protein
MLDGIPKHTSYLETWMPADLRPQFARILQLARHGCVVLCGAGKGKLKYNSFAPSHPSLQDSDISNFLVLSKRASTSSPNFTFNAAGQYA